MIIVEGPDGAGRTTLVHTLLEEYPQLKLGVRGVSDRTELWKSTVGDTFRALSEAVHNKQTYLWDRLFYSEFIYAPATDRQIAFNGYQQTFITRMIREIRCPVIVCWLPLEVCLENLDHQRQMKGVRENYPRIWQQYHDHFEDGGFFPYHTVQYDYRDKTAYHTVTTFLDEYLRHKERLAW